MQSFSNSIWHRSRSINSGHCSYYPQGCTWGFQFLEQKYKWRSTHHTDTYLKVLGQSIQLAYRCSIWSLWHNYIEGQVLTLEFLNLSDSTEEISLWSSSQRWTFLSIDFPTSGSICALWGVPLSPAGTPGVHGSHSCTWQRLRQPLGLSTSCHQEGLLRLWKSAWVCLGTD